MNDDVAEEELPHNTDTCVEFDPDCGECVKQRLNAYAATVPLNRSRMSQTIRRQSWPFTTGILQQR